MAGAAALVAWLATRGGEDSSEPELPAGGGGAPRIVTADELGEAASALGQPVYWAGPIAGRELELKRLPGGGGVQVVYRPQGAGVETAAGSASWLTVGSYPLPDAKAELEGFAERPESIVRQAGDGREVVTSEKKPTSVYFVSPEGSVQVEVYDPSAQRAMTLAISGKVQPAG